MSAQSLKDFGVYVKSNPEIQEKIKSAANVETVRTLASDAGFTVTIEEIDSAFQNAMDGADLTADQLEAVAGGAGFGAAAAGMGIATGGRVMGWW